MSVDDRLRSALRDQADSFLPSVEGALDRVHARGRAERWRSAAVAMTSSAAAVAAIIGALALLGVPGREGTTGPVEQPTASTSGTPTDTAPTPLRGSITGDIDQPGELAGRWTVRLNGNGTMDVTPPLGYAGDVSRALFTADGTSFRTTLFQADLCRGDGTGIYDWLRVGEQVEFQVVSDTCDSRSRFFEDSAWSVSTAAEPPG